MRISRSHASAKCHMTRAEEALQKLLKGNLRFIANKGEACRRSTARLRRKLASGQTPSAIILSCSDSRVPPELIFDQSLGEIFVVRVAGNVPDPVVLGSIEYAAEHFGASLLMVLGHKRCGAVIAAVKAQSGKAEGNLEAILQALAPAVDKARRDAKGKETSEVIEAAVNNNITLAAQALYKNSPVLRTLVRKKKLTVVGAKYDLDDGTVRLIEKTCIRKGAP